MGLNSVHNSSGSYGDTFSFAEAELKKFRAVTATVMAPSTCAVWIGKVAALLPSAISTEGGTVAAQPNGGSAPRLSVMPNPFQEMTTIRFDLSRSDRAKVTIHDVSGRLVRMLLDDNHSHGQASISWDGQDENAHELPGGMYFARISTWAEVQTQKIIKLK